MITACAWEIVDTRSLTEWCATCGAIKTADGIQKPIEHSTLILGCTVNELTPETGVGEGDK